MMSQSPIVRLAIRLFIVSTLGVYTVFGATTFGVTGFGAIAVASPAVVAPNGPRWTYEGASGPDYWGELSQEFSACSAGTQQSPIDLHDAMKTERTELTFHYEPTPLRMLNNGRTIQVNYNSGSSLALDGQTYDLLQFHFHDPSEHTIDGISYPLEAHLVHQNADTKEWVVVSVFFDIGAEANASLDLIWDNSPKAIGHEMSVEGITVNAADLLPDILQDNYRYVGSLTTPPCSEPVNWIVMKQPILVSRQQVESFVAAVGHNARPLQALGHRSVLN